MKRHNYTYAILQYRHDVWSHEALNVGVSVMSAELGRFAVKTRRASGRLLCAYPDLARKSLSDALRAIDRSSLKVQDQFLLEVDASNSNALAVSRTLVRLDDSSLMWISGGSGSTKDLDETMHALFDRYVTKFDKPHDKTLRSDDDVWRPVRDTLASSGVTDSFEEKTIRSEVDEVNFRSGWKNGAWHVVEPLSFDLGTAEGITEKATRWTGHLYNLKDANEDFTAYFVVGKPSSASLSGAYDNALKILRRSHGEPNVIEETNAKSLAGMLSDKLHHN